jgi:hypothetical protein
MRAARMLAGQWPELRPKSKANGAGQFLLRLGPV